MSYTKHHYDNALAAASANNNGHEAEQYAAELSRILPLLRDMIADERRTAADPLLHVECRMAASYTADKLEAIISGNPMADTPAAPAVGRDCSLHFLPNNRP